MRIFHRGLILVGVPFLLELVLIGSLLLLLNQSEQERSVESLYRKYYAINAKLLGLVTSTPFVAAAAVQFASEKLWDQYHHLVGEIHLSWTALDDLLKANPSMSTEDSQKLKTSITSVLSLTDQLEQFGRSGDHHNIMIPTPELQQSFVDNKDKASENLLPMIAHGNQLTVEFQNRLDETRRLQTIILLAGLAINVLAAIGLGIYFRKTITDRIMIIAQNALAAAENKRLLAEMGGTDEIAELDHAFHVMRRQLQNAATTEQELFDSASDVICVIDAAGKIERISPSCMSNWGFSPHELQGQSLEALVIPQDSGHLRGSIEQCKQSQGKSTFEASIATKQQGTRVGQFSAYWSQDERRLFCIIHDATEAKQVETLRRRFLSMIASDLKRPLTIIASDIAQLLSPGPQQLPAAAASKMQAVEPNAQRVLGLVNDLLQVADIDGTTLQLNRQQVGIASLFDRAKGELEALARKRGIVLDSRPSNGTVYIDYDRMMQVLVNLLSNAIKFSPDRSSIIIDAHEDNGFAVIEVKDQGRGITKSAQAAIFERFAQAEVADGKRKAGTGLGLPICKDIVEQHGGRISVESEEGKGSTFRVYVPLDKAAAQRGTADRMPSSEVRSQKKGPPADLFQKQRTGLRVPLSLKALILVGVPILIQIAFVGTVLNTVQQIDKDRAKELHLRDLAFTTTRILTLIVEASMVAQEDKNIKNFNRLQSFGAEWNDSREHLKALVQGDPTAEELEKKFDQQCSLINDFINAASEKMKTGYSDDKWKKAIGPRLKLLPSMIKITFYLENLSAHVETAELENPDRERFLRRKQLQVLLGFLAANVIICVILAIIFSLGISRRLSVIRDNTTRVFKELPLAPEIDGNDEISDLDDTFHQTARAMSEARKKQRSVFDNSKDMLCVLDDQGSFLSFNPAAETMLGYLKDDLPGTLVLRLVHPDDYEPASVALLASNFSTEGRVFECRMKTRDGKYVNTLWSVSRRQGSPNTYCVVQDVTQKRSLERWRREFMAVVSHDVRTPLSSVMSTVEFMTVGALGALPDACMAFLDRITTHCQTLVELVSDILDLEKLDAGQMKLAAEPCVIQDIGSSVVSAASGLPGRLNVQYFGGAAGQRLRVDKDRLAQALLNLTRFTVSRGAPGDEYYLQFKQEPNSLEARLVDGSGHLGPNSVNDLFRRMQADETSQGFEPGQAHVNLGLRLALKILVAHGGRIEPGAQQDRAVFHIWLPPNLS